MKSKNKKKNLKLGTLMIIILLVYTVVVCTIVQLLYNKGKQVMVFDNKIFTDVYTLENALQSEDNDLLNLLNNYLDFSYSDKQTLFDDIATNKELINEIIERYKTFEVTDTQLKRFEAVETSIVTYNKKLDSIINQLKNDNLEVANKIYVQEFNGIKSNTGELIEALLYLHKKDNEDKINSYINHAYILFFFMLIFTTTILICIVLAQKTIDKQEQKIKESTTAIKNKQSKLEYLGYTDVLTDCLSRGKFVMDMDSVDNKSIKPNEHIFMTLVNITDFKTINQLYGYNVGDEVLFQVSSRLKIVNPETDVYRIGNDEFIYLMKYEDTQSNAYNEFIDNLDKVFEELFRPIKITDNLVGNLSYKVGVVHLDASNTLTSDVALKCQEAVNYCRSNRAPAFIFKNLNDNSPEIINFNN